MTSQHGIEGLRADVPAVEPDAVLLAQLVELSSASASSSTTSRASSMKVLLAAAGVGLVVTTTWAAGAVTGSPFPSRPAHHPHTVVPPSATPSGQPTRTPGAPNPTSKAPGSIHPTPDGPARDAAPGAAPTVHGAGTPHPAKHTDPAAARAGDQDHGRWPGSGREPHRGRGGAGPLGGRPRHDADTRRGDQSWSGHAEHGDGHGDGQHGDHGDGQHGDHDRDHGGGHGREAGPP